MRVCIRMRVHTEPAAGPEIARWLNTTRTPNVRAVALCGTLKEHNVHSPVPTIGPPQLVNIKVVWRVASDRAPVCTRERRGVLLVLSWRALSWEYSIVSSEHEDKGESRGRRPTSSFSAEYIRLMIFNESQEKSRRARCLVISPGSYDLALSNDTLHFALYALRISYNGLCHKLAIFSGYEIFVAPEFYWWIR